MDWEDLTLIQDPVLTVDILKEDVLLRYFASSKSNEMDHLFMEWALCFLSRYKVVPEWVDRPTVICTLTNTPIAVANGAWENLSDESRFLEQTSLGNGWTR